MLRNLTGWFPDYHDAMVLDEAINNKTCFGSHYLEQQLAAYNARNYPNDAHVLNLACKWAGSDQTRHKIFVDNPSHL